MQGGDHVLNDLELAIFGGLGPAYRGGRPQFVVFRVAGKGLKTSTCEIRLQWPLDSNQFPITLLSLIITPGVNIAMTGAAHPPSI